MRELPDTVFSGHFAAPTFKDTSYPASKVRGGFAPPSRDLLEEVTSPPEKRREDNRRLSSMDSGLEAFSHNPTDGSFAPLSFQTSANTNYLR